MITDISYALRTMAKNRGLTLIVVLTLALGIGANTAMFSVLNAVLLRPLPYPNSNRLVTIPAQIPSMNIYGADIEYNTYVEYWHGRSKSFEAMSGYSPGWMILTSGDAPERLFSYRVNAGFLSMIGTKPEIGREFLPEEDQPGAARVAMVSHRLWERRFGRAPGLVGRPIVLDHNSYTVVGVLPAKFDFYDASADIYAPIASSSARGRGMPHVGVYARLKPGVTLAAAQAEIDGLCRLWVENTHYPKDWGAHVWRLHDYNVREVRSSVVLLMVAVGLVLLVACANVANLLMARAAGRRREIAIRATLGAGPGRIIRQLLTESALLALVAGALGLLAAWGGVRVLAASSGGYVPFQEEVGIDLPVLLFTLGAALLTAFLFGLAPALAAVRIGLAENLKEGGRSGGVGARRSRFGAILVVAEVALALLLAIGSTLTARSLARLQSVNPGFNPEGVLTAYVTLPKDNYAKPEQRVNFFRNLLERLQTMPGVKSAGMVSHLPFSHSKSGGNVVIEGAPPRKPGEEQIAFARSVDPNYFQTMQVRLLKGRYFDAHDPAGSAVAIINETMARKCWPNQDPVGKRFGDGHDHWTTVVGVIADMRQTSLADEPDMESYIPHTQSADETMALVLRSSSDPAGLGATLRAAVSGLDKELPVSDISTLSGSISHSTRSQRFTTLLLGAFALLALLLAAVGIYGVISYSVMCRTHEIGVRMALGAERARIARMVVSWAVLLAAVGVIIGVGGSLALTRLLRSMLYEVSPTDPAVFGGAAIFMLAVAALAGYLPARRAARVDPMDALRQE
jgi:putative ABC transport system permease protein